MLFHLSPTNVGRERPRVNRCAQVFICQCHGTNMVFMGVRDENRLNLVTSFLQPCDIRHDQIDPWCAIHIRKGHTNIHDNQTFSVLRPVAVDVAIHADLTCSAQRQINQTVRAHKLNAFPCCIRI